MSKITITIETKRVSITQVFDEKILGTPKNVLRAALEWLAVGTEYERKVR